MDAINDSGASGYVSLSISRGKIVGVARGSGFEASKYATDCVAANCMGVHVHDGTSCVDADAQGGHFYSGSIDPWATAVYSKTTSEGEISSAKFALDIGTCYVEY